jgi:hypothetical protein
MPPGAAPPEPAPAPWSAYLKGLAAAERPEGVAADVQLHLGASGLPVYKAAAARVLPEFSRQARAQLPGGQAFAACQAAEERVRDTPALEPFFRVHRQKLRA